MRIKSVSFCLLVISAFLASCAKKNDVENSRSASWHPKLPLGYLDLPNPGTSVSAASKILPISGWALSDAGIESVLVYLDGAYVISAQISLPRADVQKAFPNMKNSEAAGWWAGLPVVGVGPGSHEIEVQIRAKDGAIREANVSVNVQP